METTTEIPTEDSPVVIDVVNTTIYVTIAVVGLLWNSILIIIFVRHREIWTTGNAMIFNLAICDILNLIIGVPLLSLYGFPHSAPNHMTFCRIRLVLRHWMTGASALSVVGLSFQRFCITVSWFKTRKYKKSTVTAVIILLVWIAAFVIALPFAFVREFYGHMCGLDTDDYGTKVFVVVYGCYYGVFLPSLVCFFSVVVAVRLRKSTKILRGDVRSGMEEVLRKRSANVVAALAVVFVVTFCPYWVFCAFGTFLRVDLSNASVVVISNLAKQLQFANSCFNPIALYLASRTFRYLFKRYFLCCSRDTEVAIGSCETSCTNSG
ncbi:hypothetical protein C0J52_21391 [Blattella germanica]|nr:hypothetical protein C0J52_21391 [Blattella germanica]